MAISPHADRGENHLFLLPPTPSSVGDETATATVAVGGDAASVGDAVTGCAVDVFLVCVAVSISACFCF